MTDKGMKIMLHIEKRSVTITHDEKHEEKVTSSERHSISGERNRKDFTRFIIIRHPLPALHTHSGFLHVEQQFPQLL